MMLHIVLELMKWRLVLRVCHQGPKSVFYKVVLGLSMFGMDCWSVKNSHI